MSAPAASLRAPWPDAVWSAPVLRGLDARARADLEAAGALAHHETGARVFAPGEPADALYVVVSGRFALTAIRRGDREPTLLRHVDPGSSFAEEALLRVGGARPMEASCARAGSVVSLPAHVLRRVVERGGGGPVFERLMRSVRRSAMHDALRVAGFERELSQADLDAVLDAAVHVDLARGDVLYRAGAPPDFGYVVGDGMVQLQSEGPDDGKRHVRAYLTRGDLVGADEALSGRPRDLGAAASGATWLVAVPRAAFGRMAARAPRAMEALRRVARDRAEAERAAAAGANTTQHVFKDLYRVAVARSLLVIDQDQCVRCGHCAWSCADVHDDGVSRLARRGDKVVSSQGAHASSLLLPNSCQHCQSPACMVDCPTGAIGRDPEGEVFIREDLCIGCASCAKACPWDNIQMAPRGGVFGGLLSVARARATAGSAEIAVKCDLCATVAGGPACVAACPTEAIARVGPADLLPDVDGAARGGATAASAGVLARPASAIPWLAAAAVVAAALAVSGGPRWISGPVAGLVTLALAGYGLPKRVGRVRAWLASLAARSRAPKAAATSRSRALFVLHLVLGIVAVGAVAWHAGWRAPASTAGALALAFWVTAAAGILGAVAYRVVPKRLTRLERGGSLPEDLAARAIAIDERTFASLTGRSELVKSLYAHVLRPYAHARLGPAWLVASGRTLREEEKRLEARIRGTLEGRGEGKLDGLPELVRLAVERRALGAQRGLSALLRAWHPLHVMGTALVLALLAIHVVVEVLYR